MLFCLLIWIKQLCVCTLKKWNYRHCDLLLKLFRIVKRAYANHIIELIFFLCDHFRMADIPHNIKALLISSVRTIKFPATKHQYYICIFLTVPILVKIDHCVFSHSIQIALQSHCIGIIPPAHLLFTVRCRAFDHPDRAIFRQLAVLCRTFFPVISSLKFLIDLLLQILQGLAVFLKQLALLFIFLFQFLQLVVHIGTAYRNQTA